MRFPDAVSREDARKYIFDRLRGVLRVEDHQIHSAIGAAVDRFSRKYRTLL